MILGKEGAFGVYKNHVNLTTTFNPSKITIRDHEENIHVIAVCSGVFQFKNNEALILTPVSEIKEEIDIRRATKLLNDAKLVFYDPNTKEYDKLLAKMYMDRAENRIKNWEGTCKTDLIKKIMLLILSITLIMGLSACTVNIILDGSESSKEETVDEEVASMKKTKKWLQ